MRNCPMMGDGLPTKARAIEELQAVIRLLIQNRDSLGRPIPQGTSAAAPETTGQP
jgi:hypothetical protein